MVDANEPDESGTFTLKIKSKSGKQDGLKYKNIKNIFFTLIRVKFKPTCLKRVAFEWQTDRLVC